MDFSIFPSFLPEGLLSHFDIVDFKELGDVQTIYLKSVGCTSFLIFFLKFKKEYVIESAYFKLVIFILIIYL